MALPPLRPFPLCLLALVVSSCAQFSPVEPELQAPRRATETAGISLEDKVGEVVANQDEVAISSAPLSLEERFPFIRFMNRGPDDISAFIVAPVGFGAEMTLRLQEYCDCLHPESGTATIKLIPNGGSYFSGDPKASPWEATPVMKPVEDILELRGPEDAIEEVLFFIDLFFNGGPQIEIQAEIFEITKTDSFQRGVQPNGALIEQLGNVSADGTGPAFRGLGGGFAASGIGDFASSGPGGIFSLAFSDDNIQINAFLQILRGMENVDIVSYPRIVTRNGVPASIDSSEEIPYLKVTTISSATGITGLAVDVKKAGVSLWVQPFLMGGDTIQMVITVHASRIGRLYEVGTDNTGRPILIPSMNTRTASTAVSVKSGHKVVIGGLKLREERLIETKIPILGDIPLLGWLFSSKEMVEAETEVMFVLTPRVKTRAPSISPFSNEIFDPFETTPN